MNSTFLNDQAFVNFADDFLNKIYDSLSTLDEDAAEVDITDGVLVISILKTSEKIIINRQRGAHQLWMAAARQAWHFDWVPEAKQWIESKSGAELYATLKSMLETMID